MYAALTLVVLSAAYVVYLDFDLRRRFEGKRWEVPARVYARALEVFPGRRLTRDDFQRELRLLRYRPVLEPRRPGTYSRQGDSFVVITRPFSFWDGHEASVHARIRFQGGRVGTLHDDSGAKALVRFDPALIGRIYPSHNEDRILVRRDEVPEVLIRALIAVEDRDFYRHHGVDSRAVGRALLANLRAGRVVQGGSTLTQQLVKNFFLSNERTFWRKANEAVMALLLEWHYDKPEILEAYLNEVYLGQEGRRAIHGFGLASRFYFERSLKDLRLDQVALLVALVKGPSFYDPRRHPERARARRDLVLDLMAEQGVVDAAAARRAKTRDLEVSPEPPSGVTRYPAFVDLVRRQLHRDYRDEDLRSEGLQIFTTLDPTAQHHADQALIRQVRRLENAAGRRVRLEGALVATRVESGEIAAVVGGREAGFAGFNRALDAVRPVGSLIKPAVYLTALAQPGRYTLASLLDDRELHLRGPDGREWVPQNYDHQYHGRVPLYAALAHSFNVATARLGTEIGVDRVVDTLRRLGVGRPLHNYPALLLGAVSLSPLEVAQMYQTLAGGGFLTPLRAIRAVLDVRGELLSRYPLTVEQAFEPGPVHLVNRALQRVAAEGTARSVYDTLAPELALAGKTGTTDDLRDSWFAGFTGDLLAVVWLGSDNNEPTGLSGAAGALRVWAALMQRLGPQPLRLEEPPDIDHAWIDPASGRRTHRDCNGAVQLPFIRGSIPRGDAPCEGRTGNWLRRILQ